MPFAARKRLLIKHCLRCYLNVMTTKEKVLKAVQGLPDDAPIEDAMERLLFLAKIEKGLEQANAGETISHDQVREKTGCT